jgi:hypothetical protein
MYKNEQISDNHDTVSTMKSLMTKWAHGNYYDLVSWLKMSWLCEHTDTYLD